jgi:hypothetical protein
MSTVKSNKTFLVNIGNAEYMVNTDHLFNYPNGDYHINGVIGEDSDINGFSSFSCSYYINYGFSGKFLNEESQTYFQIIPIDRPLGVNHTNPEVFICKWFPDKFGIDSECTTPPTEPEPEDGDDNVDPIEPRTICNRSVRVLFLFTNRAAVSGSNPAIVAQNVIDELNTSVSASQTNQLTATYVNAGAINLPGFVEFDDMGDDLDDLVNDPTANQLRNDNFADLVVLLTNGAAYGPAGKAKDIKTNERNAYAIAQIFFASTGFTASHEIGHMMGCRHQRCSTCGTGFLGLTGGCDIIGRGHGFKLCTTGRTIMYQNGCDNTTRMARFSNQDSDFMGCPSGSWWNNNIRSMRNHACTVADFRPDPTSENNEFAINIDGPSTASMCMAGNWNAIIEQEQNSTNQYIYKWEKSDNGISNWCTVSNTININNYQLLNTCYTSSGFYLRLIVSLASNQSIFEIDQMYITWGNCFEGEIEIENRSISGDGCNINIFPNPSSDFILVNSGHKVLSLSDIQGKPINANVKNKNSGEYNTIDLSNLVSGIYFLHLACGDKLETVKIIKQ